MADPDLWNTMTADAQKAVLARMNIGYGIVLDETHSFAYGTKLWELSGSDFSDKYPSRTGTYHTEAFETQIESNLTTFGLTKVTANAGISGTIEGVKGGGKASTTHTTETENSTDTEKKTYYMFAEYVVPKITLILKEDRPTLSPRFIDAMRKLLDGSSDSVRKLTSAYALLDTNGWYLSSSLTLGGRLYQTQAVKTNKTTTKSRVEEKFQADFEANVGVPEVFEASGGGGTTTETKTTRSNSVYESVTSESRVVVGGDPKGLLKKNGLSPWIASLSAANTWMVIGVELIPVAALLPTDVLNSFRKLQTAFGAYETATKAMVLDAKSYFREVEDAAPTGLSRGWC